MASISIEEFLHRQAILRDALESHQLDLILIYSWKRGHVRYITGYHPNYIANAAIVIVHPNKSPVMFIRFPFDLIRAKSECWFTDIYATGNLLSLSTNAAEYVNNQELSFGRIGIITDDGVMDEMPYSMYRKIEKDLNNVEIVDASSLLLDSRRLKSMHEFEMIRNSAKLADEAIGEAINLFVPDQTEFELIANFEAASRKRGAQSYLATLSSKNGKGPIGPPCKEKIKYGDIVIIEFAVEVGGYWTQVAHTFHVGSPSEDESYIYSVAYDAYQAGIKAARPGKKISDLYEAIYKVTDAAGFAEYLKVDIGHGIGLDLPELPSIDDFDHSAIEPGMALVIHPALEVPQRGRVFVGGTILVHDHGAEPIHKIVPNLEERK